MNDISPQEGTVLAILAAYMVVIVAIVAITYAIQITTCWLMYICFSRVPIEHRKAEAWWPWLLLIPCFALVWNFIVLDRLAKSFTSYCNAAGLRDVGDCGAGLFLAYSITVVLSCVPYVNCLAAPTSLVLLILTLIKAWELSKRIEADVQQRRSTPSAP